MALVRFSSEGHTPSPVVVQPPTSPTSGAFAAGAQRWFDAGWTPLPVDNQRIPKVSGYHGKDRITVTQQILDKWLKQHPDEDLAVVIPEGVVCIDIDTHDEKDGNAEFARITEELSCEMGESVIQSTRDARVHGHRFYLFDVSQGSRVRKTMAGTKYVDIKGPGGFISVSPTKHHSLGTDYKWYEYDGVTELPANYVPDMNHFCYVPETWRGQIEKLTVRYQVEHHGGLKRFSNKPGDKWASLFTWDELLEGYFEFTGTTNDVGHILRRVGSKQMVGAVLSFDTDKLIVFSSSYNDFLPPVEDGGAYSKYQAAVRIKLMHENGHTEDEAFGPGSHKLILELNGVDEKGEPFDRKTKLKIRRASTVKMRPVRYLWKGGILSGALNLLAGKPGTGKSTFTYNLTADITNGTVKGDYYNKPGQVLVVSTEDSDEHVIIPKLRAAGANMDLVALLEVDSMFAFPEDVGLVRELLESLNLEHPEKPVRLIILDPLVNRISAELNAHRDKDVRQALEPFQSLAEEYHMTVLGIVHNNKATDQDPLYSISGSTAFGAVSRATLVLSKAEDYEENHERSVGIVKNNWGPDDLPAYRFKIEGSHLAADHEDEIGEAITTSRLVWVKKSEVTQTEEIKKRKQKDQATGATKKEGVMDTALEDMIQFLQESGPSTSPVIDSNVKANPRTLNEMRRRARQTGELIYNTKTSLWCLPSQSFSYQLQLGGILPNGATVSGSLPTALGDFFQPDATGIAQILSYIVSHPNDSEAKDHAEREGWL